ncbi:hypothetical protein [Halobacterium sp. KA-6]|uniref:hypothetical protein n=1 Tax=Halobacterium sp. KA-6 TaxID=2896368 RepID=UPI001E31BCF5|nr:hypothetical protein [Halobacterium sp. KA-6]MCD2204521.1 hypothetical protein [Halobacterium sp. KA-6]
MSTTETPTAVTEAQHQFQNDEVAAAFETLTEEVQRLHAENQRLNERVSELEQQHEPEDNQDQKPDYEHLEERVTDLERDLENQPNIEWEGPDPKDLAITATAAGNTVKPYKAIRDRVETDQFDHLDERVRDLEDGNVDIVVRGEFDGEELPIERKIAERNAGGDLTANKARATLVFPKFGTHAQTHGGSQLVLSSSDVRTILAETTDRCEWPNETIKRVMQWTAKLTSRRDNTQNLRPRDDQNLLTLRTGRNGELELVADLEDYQQYYDQLQNDQP